MRWGMKLKVNFHDEINDKDLKFAVIMARYNDKWIFCKHRERETYEIPGGHREMNENILDTARRELQEETGAIDYNIEPITVYSVTRKDIDNNENETFGMLFYAEVHSLKDTLENEIEEIKFFDRIPVNLTYPEIQPYLYKKVIETKIHVAVCLGRDIMKDNVIIKKVDNLKEKKEIVSEVLLDLPEWFGLAESTKHYIQDSKKLPLWVARNNLETIGFITLAESSLETGELHCMGIKKAYHRKGIGKRLYMELEQYAKDKYKYLQVKTVDEGYYKEYDQTITFYKSIGFSKLEVFPSLWDEWNPCLIMIKCLN